MNRPAERVETPGGDPGTRAAGPEGDPAPRRTSLAAERTWLAWWRTGLAAAAVALAVGRLLPGVAHGTRWPFRVLGIGYGLLAIAVVVMGAVRHRRGTAALRRGGFDELSGRSVVALTAAAVVLGTVTLVIIIAEL
jgi:putative membrane protein